MLPILIPIVTELMKNGLGTLANAVMNKGKEVVEDKLGIKIDDMLQTPEGVLKLKQLEVDHEEFLITAAIDNRKLDLQFYQADAEDRTSARDMNTKVQESEYASWLAKNINPILSLIVVIGGGTILALTNDADIKYGVVSIMTLVLGFHFGTSSGSAKKDSTINNLSK